MIWLVMGWYRFMEMEMGGFEIWFGVLDLWASYERLSVPISGQNGKQDR